MNNKKSIFSSCVYMIGLLCFATATAAFEGHIPKNTKHFRIEQTTYFRVYNNVAQPGYKSSFEVDFDNKTHLWAFVWHSPTQKNRASEKLAKGKFRAVQLKNGVIEITGSSETTEDNHKGRKEYENFTSYHKTYYPMKNLKDNYYFIAHLNSNKGEMISTGQAHFIFSNK